jgi:ABC-type glycerol-3-phosphate transport system substrate-binding protein
VFKPENVAKLKGCGVTLLDTPSELIPIALNYLGEDPNSQDPAVIDKAAALLKTIRPYVTNFHSSQYIDSMATGNTCLVVGWSGDIIQARDRAEEAKNGVKIAYSIPKEGAPLWFDMLAIPKDAKHVESANAFINHLLEPQVAAEQHEFRQLSERCSQIDAAGRSRPSAAIRRSIRRLMSPRSSSPTRSSRRTWIASTRGSGPSSRPVVDRPVRKEFDGFVAVDDVNHDPQGRDLRAAGRLGLRQVDAAALPGGFEKPTSGQDLSSTGR